MCDQDILQQLFTFGFSLERQMHLLTSSGVDRLLLNTTHSWIFKAQHAAERTSGLGTDGSAFEPIKLFDLPSWHAELQSETWPAGVEISQGNEEETNQGTRGDVLFYAQ
ncbi:hypothetical protein KCU87_g459, partial [Aureobasidium melanogenum]